MKYKPKYFKAREFYDITKMSEMLLFILDIARGAFGRKYPKVSFNINYSNNPKDKHVPNSKHYSNEAVDMYIKAYYDYNKENPVPYKDIVIDLVQLFKITTIWDNIGIGIYPDWHRPGFHLDFSPHNHREWQAHYKKDKNGKIIKQIYTGVYWSSFKGV